MGFKITLLACASTCVLASVPALAQQDGLPDAVPQDEDGARSEVGDEIVVTGSRIRRQDYVSESPIVTVEDTFLESTGAATVDETLNQLPQFTASATGQTSSAAGGGRATVNLRGLGIERTLVLIDGRRYQPSDPLGAVDLNTIAPSLIETVEVITGGASAVYGSDAIAGVVNFILQDDFEGVELDVQYGETDENDAESVSVAFTAGGEFGGGRGNGVVSLSYFDRQEAFRSNRDFFDAYTGTCCPNSGLYIPEGINLPSNAVLNEVFTAYGFPGQVNFVQPLGANPDGTLFSFRVPETLSPEAIASGLRPVAGPTVRFFGPDGDRSYLQQPLERYTAFGDVSYDLTDAVRAHARFNFATYEAAQFQPFGELQATTIPSRVNPDNALLPEDFRTVLDSRRLPDAPFVYYFTAGRIAPREDSQRYNVSQFEIGLDGDDFFRDWTWSIYGTVGRTEGTLATDGQVSRSAFDSLILADDGGQSLCPGGFAPFGFDPVSDGCRDYLVRRTDDESTLEQKVVEAVVQGGLLDLPAGEVRFAAGASYRSNEYDFEPDSQITFQEVLGTGVVESSGGFTDVKEVFAEALVPVIGDLPFVEELNLNLAYRLSDYDSVGSVSAYKASGDWAVAPSLRVRGGYQRAVRAPSVGELFSARTARTAGIGRRQDGAGDPCDTGSALRTGANAAQVRDLCLATGVPSPLIDDLTFNGSAVLAYEVGNPDLEEETADTFTAGLVWQSGFENPILSDLSVSLDYYDISLEGAIGQVTADVSLLRCFNGDGGSNPSFDPSNFFCQQINRDPSGQLSFVDEPALNLGAYETSGIDLQTDWRLDLADFVEGDPGRVAINSIVSYTDKYEIQTIEGAPFLDYAGTIGNGQIDPFAVSHPNWRAVTSLSYSKGPAVGVLRWRYVGDMDNANNVGNPDGTAPGVPGTSYLDLTGRWDVRPGSQLRAGVINLTDQAPRDYTGDAGTDPGTYDLLQRRFYVGFTQRF